MTDSAAPTSTPPSPSAARLDVNVADFGADPTGVTDSTDAVRRALAHAAAAATAPQTPVRLSFPTGRYGFWSRNATRRELYVSNTVGADPRYREKKIGILVEGFDDLEIAGNGSLFEYHGRQTTIAVLDSARVTLHDFAIDMVQPTVIEATVAKAGLLDGRAFRLIALPPGTVWSADGTDIVWHGEVDPETGEEDWRGSNAMDYSQLHDSRRDLTWRQECPLFTDVATITRTADGILITYRTDELPTDTGLTYQLRHTDRDHPGILALECGSVSFRDVRVHYLHGFGLVAQNGGDLTLDHVDFATPAGSMRSTAGFADFVQGSGMAGSIEIAHCRFDGAHDDAINIHGTYLRVEGPPSGDQHSLRLSYAHPETAGFPQFGAGDKAELIETATGKVVVTGIVVDRVDGPSGRDHARSLTTMTVRFRDPLPALVTEASPGQLAIENISRTPSLSVHHCAFVNLPTRGILVSTRRPIRIHDNEFTKLPMAGIFISSDAAAWWESGPVRDCVIERNSFTDLGGPAVRIEPGQYPSDGSATVHSGITVQANRIQISDADDARAHEAGRLIVEATSVADLVVRDNSLTLGGSPLAQPPVSA